MLVLETGVTIRREYAGGTATQASARDLHVSWEGVGAPESAFDYRCKVETRP